MLRVCFSLTHLIIIIIIIFFFLDQAFNNFTFTTISIKYFKRHIVKKNNIFLPANLR